MALPVILRCTNCFKLLGKTHGKSYDIEIKCPRCHTMNNFAAGQTGISSDPQGQQEPAKRRGRPPKEN